MTTPNHHDHHHAQARAANRRRLAWTLVLIAGYMVAEIVGGLLTHSLALLADAGHMLSDAAALGLSLFAAWLAERPPTSRRTYGYYRTEILAALANGATLVAISVYIVVEALRRMHEPPAVLGGPMLGVASGGLLVNIVALMILHRGRDENLNIRGAWLHVLTDALGSVAAMAAGALIWAFDWNWTDAVASVLIALLVVYSAWRLLAESVAVLMESAPRGVDVDAIREALLATPGVAGVHDLHVWTITTGLDSLSAHIVVTNGGPAIELLTCLRHLLHDRFGIEHVTLQIEPADFEERAACN